MERTNKHAQNIKLETSKPKFNIELKPSITVNGYQIRNKQIELGQGTANVTDGNFMKEMRKTIKEPVNFKNWMVVYWAEQKGYEIAELLYETIT